MISFWVEFLHRTGGKGRVRLNKLSWGTLPTLCRVLVFIICMKTPTCWHLTLSCFRYKWYKQKSIQCFSVFKENYAIKAHFTNEMTKNAMCESWKIFVLTPSNKSMRWASTRHIDTKDFVNILMILFFIFLQVQKLMCNLTFGNFIAVLTAFITLTFPEIFLFLLYKKRKWKQAAWETIDTNKAKIVGVSVHCWNVVNKISMWINVLGI